MLVFEEGKIIYLLAKPTQGQLQTWNNCAHDADRVCKNIGGAPVFRVRSSCLVKKDICNILIFT